MRFGSIGTPAASRSSRAKGCKARTHRQSDGFTLIERIRSDPALRHIPAILVTSRAAAEDRRRGHEVGAQGYIVKSAFDQAELLTMIKSLMG